MRMYIVKSMIILQNKKVFSTLSVYNDELDIYGVLDCVEFIKDDDGTLISELDDKYKVKIIEYKPTKPQNNEFWESDAIQVFAQKLCIDYIFNCNSEAYIYYSNIKRRIELPFYNDYDKYKKQITEYLHDMRYYLLRHEIPSISKGQNAVAVHLLIFVCLNAALYTRNKILSLMEDL